MGGEGSMAYMIHIMNQRMERVKQMRERKREAISFDNKSTHQEVASHEKVDPVILKKLKKEYENDLRKEKRKQIIIILIFVIIALVVFPVFFKYLNVW